ncbi:MAG: NAD(P)H-hydrate dehydratase [Ruminococcaceae bacterium]|nr:NAD(P)H-hydrate dehydratase [Oscillospiraceae bacterium]
MHTVFSYNKDNLSLMPKRTDESNKGTYGRLLCVCGSVGMCGAAYLAAKAAYRTGAGLVEILTVKENLIPLQGSLPEAIISVYDGNDPDLDAVLTSVERADAIVIGCGLGRSAGARKILGAILRSTEKQCVVDADALNIISANPALKKHLRDKIITPHPMEFSRLTGISTDEILKNTERLAYGFARENGAVCLIKRHETIISDGSERVYVNKSGNSGMATAGSGDVLAGIIGGILAQNKNSDLSLFEAACLGTYIHGLCGDIAAEALGEYSLMASDIIDSLRKVLKSI